MARKSTASTKSDNELKNMKMDDARKAVLDKAVGDIVKRYGEGAIIRMGESAHLAVDVIPTGSLSLVSGPGVGGIPKARVTEKSDQGVVFMSFHFHEAAANLLTNAALDPVSKIPEYKFCAVKIEKIFS